MASPPSLLAPALEQPAPDYLPLHNHRRLSAASASTSTQSTSPPAPHRLFSPPAVAATTRAMYSSPPATTSPPQRVSPSNLRPVVNTTMANKTLDHLPNKFLEQNMDSNNTSIAPNGNSMSDLMSPVNGVTKKNVQVSKYTSIAKLADTFATFDFGTEPNALSTFGTKSDNHKYFGLSGSLFKFGNIEEDIYRASRIVGSSSCGISSPYESACFDKGSRAASGAAGPRLQLFSNDFMNYLNQIA